MENEEVKLLEQNAGKVGSILVFPDIHGRQFWKEGLILRKDGEPVIFLGDYLDPYTGYEEITSGEAFNNFLEILNFAQTDNNSLLLMGNHDWHYIVNLDQCRLDKLRENKIEKLILDNLKLFRLTAKIGNCLFSHAGITQKWLNDVSGLAIQEVNEWDPGEGENFVDPKIDDRYLWIKEMSQINNTHNFELLEKCLQNYDDYFYSAPISMISRDRGGWYPHGSCIWADIHEHFYTEPLKDVYQIFSHTYNTPGEIINKNNFWMVDCQRPIRVFLEDTPKVEVL